MTEDETVGWHHRLNAHECERAPGNGEGQEAWQAAAGGIRRVGRGSSTEQHHFNRNVPVFAVCAETPPSGQPFPAAAQLPTLWG